MQFRKSAKAIFLILNHITATQILRHEHKLNRLHEDNQVTRIRQLPNDATATRGALFPRASDPPKQCPLCRSKCRPNRWIDPQDCRKCIPCPPGTTSAPDSKSCIPEKTDEDKRSEEENDRKAKKEEKFQSVKETKKTEYTARQKKKQKDEKFQAKKERKKEEYEAKRVEKEDKNKVRRMARCISLVGVSMGAAAIAPYAQGFFDEAFFESMALLDLWPPGVSIDATMSEEAFDKLFEDDKFIEKWVAMGNSIGGPFNPQKGPFNGMSWKRAQEIEEKDIHQPGLQLEETSQLSKSDEELRFSTNSSLSVIHGTKHRKRFLGFIFGALVKLGLKIGKFARKVTKNTVEIAQGKGKKSIEEQKEGARKISEDKNWVNCVKGRDPE